MNIFGTKGSASSQTQMPVSTSSAPRFKKHDIAGLIAKTAGVCGHSHDKRK